MARGLEGKVAIVTGSSRGIGRAVALALAGEGAYVVVAARTTEATRDHPGSIYETAAKIAEMGERALPIRVDITSEADVDALVKRVVEELGSVHLLVNNAGLVEVQGSFLETSLERWERMLRVNLTGQFLCAQAVVPQMIGQGGGCIINISSGAATRTAGTSLAYGVSKAALDRLTLGLAEELRPYNISVISVHPGVTATEGLLQQMPPGDHSWMNPPQRTAQAVAYLATHEPMRFSGMAISVREIIEKYGLEAAQ